MSFIEKVKNSPSTFVFIKFDLTYFESTPLYIKDPAQSISSKLKGQDPFSFEFKSNQTISVHPYNGLVTNTWISNTESGQV